MKILYVLCCLFLFSSQASACSFSSPSGTISEWVNNKTVFWGRAINTEWERPTGSEFAPNVITTFEVLEPVKGELKKTIKVRHVASQPACGLTYDLGRIQLYVVSETDTKSYTSWLGYRMNMNPLFLWSYLSDGKDMPIKEMERLESKRWDNADECWEAADTADICKSYNQYESLQETYNAKLETLYGAASHPEKRWWSLLPFTD